MISMYLSLTVCHGLRFLARHIIKRRRGLYILPMISYTVNNEHTHGN